jgi:ATP synthase protein I
MGTGWSVFSYLISGLLAYGGIGWVIAHFTHVSLFFPIGMLVGLAISTGWIVYKYGRPHRTPRREMIGDRRSRGRRGGLPHFHRVRVSRARA